MFAGSCIGVILLVVSLEFLRRLSREYDRFILRQHQRGLPGNVPHSGSTSTSEGGADKGAVATTARPVNCGPQYFRPNLMQQAVRALLHMMQFAVAYFVML